MATLEVKIISLQRIVDHDPGCSQTGSPPHPKSGSGKLTRLQHGNGVITASVDLPPHKLLFYDKTSLKAQIGLMVMNIRIARPRNALWRAILMHQQSTLDIFFLHKKRKALICSGVDQSWGEHQPQEHSREHSFEFGKDVTCSIIDQHICLSGPGTTIPRWRLSSKKMELWTATGLPIP